MPSNFPSQACYVTLGIETQFKKEIETYEVRSLCCRPPNNFDLFQGVKIFAEKKFPILNNSKYKLQSGRTVVDSEESFTSACSYLTPRAPVIHFTIILELT